MKSNKILQILSLIGVLNTISYQNQCDAFTFSSNIFSTSSNCHNNKSFSSHLQATTEPNNNYNNRDEMIISSRRNVLLTLGLTGLGAFTSNTAANAAEDKKEATIWKSGKEPVVPGKKPRDKNDTSGTRKDPDFLRSIATCKNQCENTYGPDGYARSKEECLSDCQDICCKTYEQCTFGIVPRM